MANQKQWGRRVKRKPIPKPWSELSFEAKYKEAKAAIARIEGQLETEYRNPNRSHIVTTNLHDSLKRWRDTLITLRMDPEIHKLDFKDI